MGHAGESSCTIFTARTHKRELESGVTVTKEEFKVTHTRDKDGVTIADEHLTQVKHILEDAKANIRTMTNHVLMTGASQLGTAEAERRLIELKAQFLKHREALLKLDKKKKARMLTTTPQHALPGEE